MIHQFQPCSLVCGDLEVGEYPGRVTEVDWKHAVDCLRAYNAWCMVERCVLLGSSALLAGCKLCEVVCPSCGVVLLEGPDWSNSKS